MGSAGLAPFAMAVAILLSVIVRALRSGTSWDAVDQGYATADHLRELTGIMKLDDLQDAFGPPRLQDGVFSVTRSEVLKNRTLTGYLLGDKWLDRGSALIALVTILPVWPYWASLTWLETLVGIAGLYQLAGWIASTRFLKKR